MKNLEPIIPAVLQDVFTRESFVPSTDRPNRHTLGRVARGAVLKGRGIGEDIVYAPEWAPGTLAVVANSLFITRLSLHNTTGDNPLRNPDDQAYPRIEDLSFRYLDEQDQEPRLEVVVNDKLIAIHGLSVSGSKLDEIARESASLAQNFYNELI